MKNSLVHLVTRRNMQRNTALAATTLALLATLAAPGYCARPRTLNPQPLPPYSNAVHIPISTLKVPSILKDAYNFFTNIIIIGGRSAR